MKPPASHQGPLQACWKRLRGQGREAVYRATCGRSGCPGHLGDLWYDSADPEVEAARIRRTVAVNTALFERQIAAGRIPDTAEVRALFAESLEEPDQPPKPSEPLPADPDGDPGWRMSSARLYADDIFPRDEDDLIYRGFADTGYRIHRPRKRGKHGETIGRRPTLVIERQDGATPYLEPWGRPSRVVVGQTVRPGDRVWCRVCGALNELGWPAQLADPAAR